MNLEKGTIINQYRIISAIGKGGIGEVYKAHDSRLDREVAIKVLPSEMSGDEDRLRRFEQEAKATSALNHPNILTVYDIVEHDGRSSLPNCSTAKNSVNVWMKDRCRFEK